MILIALGAVQLLCCDPTERVSKKEGQKQHEKRLGLLKREKESQEVKDPFTRCLGPQVCWLTDYLPGVACPCFCGHNVTKLLNGRG